MSWSMRLPEDPPVCECKYDEIRDEMDRDDCPFHCDLSDPTEDTRHGRKPPETAPMRTNREAA